MQPAIYTINEQQIAVYQSGNNDAETIFFVHGNSCNGEFWMPQLTDAVLYSKYRLVAYDMAGHGQSDHNGRYSLKDMAATLGVLIDTFKPSRYIVCGISYGTCVIGEAAPVLPGCAGFFLTGSNLVNNEHTPATFLAPYEASAALGLEHPTEKMLSAFAHLMVYNQESPVADDFIKSYKATDPTFRTALTNDIIKAAWTDEWANLNATNKQVAFCYGKEEVLIKTEYVQPYPTKWRNAIQYIDNGAHLVNNEQPAAFNLLLKEFADDVFTRAIISYTNKPIE